MIDVSFEYCSVQIVVLTLQDSEKTTDLPLLGLRRGRMKRQDCLRPPIEGHTASYPALQNG